MRIMSLSIFVHSIPRDMELSYITRKYNYCGKCPSRALFSLSVASLSYSPSSELCELYAEVASELVLITREVASDDGEEVSNWIKSISAEVNLKIIIFPWENEDYSVMNEPTVNEGKRPYLKGFKRVPPLVHRAASTWWTIEWWCFC